MNASARVTEACPDCGGDLPAGARYCPACGSDLGAGLVRFEETPVSYEQAEPRWFGVAPPLLVLGAAAVAVVAAVVLFATGRWPYGLILLGVAALLLAVFLEAAKRRPEPALVRRSTHARDRAQTAVETWRARSAAGAHVRRLRRSLMLLDGDRRSLLLELGRAVHGRDAEAEARVRGQLAELDAREAALRSGLEHALEEAGERIRRARLPVQETMMVLPTEPGPPPDEATPPQPAVVPEPYPPPDEADPPEPARVPERGPEER